MRLESTKLISVNFLNLVFLLSFRLFTSTAIYFRFVTFCRIFSKSKVLCKIKAEVFSENSWPSFYVLLFKMFILESRTIGVPNFRLFSWKSFFWLKVSVWNIKCDEYHSFWLYLLQNRVYTALTLLLYKPWLYFCVLTQHAAAVQSRRRLSKSQVPASLLSELKFRAGPPMIVSAPGCK